MRGDLRAVVRAILLDAEARGDVKTDANYGRLRHPAQFIAGVLRAFDARSADGAPERRISEPADREYGHGRVPAALRVQLFLARDGGARHRRRARPGVRALLDIDGAPAGEFREHDGLLDHPVSANAPSGTSLDLSPLQALAGKPDALVDALNVLLLHGTMSAAMRDTIRQACSRSPPEPVEARPDRRLPGRHVVAVSGGEVAMQLTRREFLLHRARRCLGYALGAAAFAAGVQRFSLINLLAQGTDYKALVCVFLAGGNDGNNMVVPTSTTEYNAYAAVRSASGLGDRARQPAADHAAQHRQPVRAASEPCRTADAVVASRSLRSSAMSARWCSR